MPFLCPAVRLGTLAATQDLRRLTFTLAVHRKHKLLMRYVQYCKGVFTLQSQ